MLSGILLPIFAIFIGYTIQPTGTWNVLFPSFIAPVKSEWIWVALLGFAALIGQIYLTKAFTYGKAGLISVAGYSNIVFSVFFGWLLGDAFPAWTSLVGIFLVILGGFLISQK
jgi:drug/metabolite transporter (DMT)-like permease